MIPIKKTVYVTFNPVVDNDSLEVKYLNVIEVNYLGEQL